MKNKENVMNELCEWHNNLNENEKNNSCVFCVIGDMENKMNYEYKAGSVQNLVVTLGQAMINDNEVCKILSDAVSLYNTFVAKEAKKAEDKKNGSCKKILS